MATEKKVKKVETPIDQKETFVSLQKSFVESGNVEEKLRTLYDLQQADNALEKLMQLRGGLPGEVAELEADLAKVTEKVAHSKDMIKEYENSIEGFKKDIEDTDADIEKYQAQLSNITNSREYDSINKELENLNLLHQIAEKKIRETQEEIASTQARIERLSAEQENRQADLDAKKEELATIVESTADEEKALQDKRDKCAKQIDERTMSAYNRIRASVRNHLAVVPVYNDSCGGCFSSITPQKLIEINSGKKLIICEHCGRILVKSDKPAEE